MDIVVVEEVQDGVNILYCKLKLNDNTIKVCPRKWYIYTRTPRLRIKIFFHNTQSWRECILLLKTQQKIICLNKKTRDYCYKYDTSAYNILLRILI